MFTEHHNFNIVQTHLDRLFLETIIGDNLFHNRPKPWDVSVKRDKDCVIISSKGFYKRIKAKDSFIDTFLGNTWEGKVIRAESEAFQTSYILWREEEYKDYQINRIIN